MVACCALAVLFQQWQVFGAVAFLYLVVKSIGSLSASLSYGMNPRVD